MSEARNKRETANVSDLAPLNDEDFQALAAFRTGLRRFIRFSENAARATGLTPQQHQLLVAVRGHDGPGQPVIGDLAEALQIRHHSAVELVDRLEQRGFIRREQSQLDNRRVHVVVTPEGEEVLRSLTTAHRQEHRQLESVFRLLSDRLNQT